MGKPFRSVRAKTVRETYAPDMLMRKQLAAASTMADDAVERLEAEGARLREEIETGVAMLVVAFAGLAAAVLVGSFVIAAGRR